MPSPTEAQLLIRLKQQGFAAPQQAILNARTAAKLGLPVAAAMLMMETGGGTNEFGHDTDAYGPCPGYGWGTVTKAKYEAFRKLVAVAGRSNGVGPAQLTSVGLLDEADQAGGAWVPQHNMAVGFHYLHDLIIEHGLEPGCAAYNGSGTAAQAYGRHLVALADHYQSIGLGTVVGVLP